MRTYIYLVLPVIGIQIVTLVPAVYAASSDDAFLQYQSKQLDSTQNASGYLKNQVINETNSKMSSFLGQYGTADVQLNVDEHAHLDGSSLDLLLPLMNKKNDLLFTQWGWRNKDDRNTLNWGVGYRHSFHDWMLGGNLFLDNDITGDNRRVGVGIEAWRDFLKLSANGYFGTTSWNDSVDREDYQEKSADGYDVRVEAFVPGYPQLGGKFVYEKYFGNDVALFGSDELQKDPYAFTFGLNYNPVPLFTMSIDEKLGSGQKNDTQFRINMNYRLGVPFSRQLSSDEVAVTKTLAYSRYDIVQRNNNIVLKYKKEQTIKIALPDAVEGYGGETTRITANVTSEYAVDHINWNASEITNAGGSYRTISPYILEITYPPFKNGESNQYKITAIAYDTKGNASEQTGTTASVLYSDNVRVNETLTILSDGAKADGVAKNVVQASVTDASGKPLEGQKVSFVASNGAMLHPADVVTDSSGQATVTLSNTTSGTSEVMATFADGATRTVDTLFVGENDITMSVIKNGAVSDGSDQNEVEATVVDDKGNPVSGAAVSFSTDVQDAVLSNTHATTDSSGKARVRISDPLSNAVVKITGMLDNGKSSTAIVNFYPLNATMDVLDNNVPADGESEFQLKITLTKHDGTPAPGQVITSEVIGSPVGVVLLTPEATTDSAGNAIIKATSTIPGEFYLGLESIAAGSLSISMVFR